MSAESKRKSPPSSAASYTKRKKGGNDGKWKTLHQNQRSLHIQRGSVEPGDVGMWVTCARGMEGKAARELQILYDEYVARLYDIRPPEDAWTKPDGTTTTENDGSVGDIEALLEQEVAALKASSHAPDRLLTPIRLNVECLLFTKMRAPIDPVELAHRICQDAKQNADRHGASDASAGSGVRRTFKYLNRLTPVTASGRANNKGVEEVAQVVLPMWFRMKGDNSDQQRPAYSFAIRLSSRHHSQLKRDDVIRAIASLIDEKHHKVSLENPDKVVLVEIFKTMIGMSVVDGNWAELKKYNLSEIYNLSPKGRQPCDKSKGTNATVETTEEAVLRAVEVATAP